MSSQKFSNEIYLSVLKFLSKDIDGSKQKLLWNILGWEKNNPAKTEYHGFEWHQVHGDPRTLNSLVIKSILQVPSKSNKSTNYRTMDAKAIEQALNDYEGLLTQPEVSQEIPSDLFDIIVNHEKKKEIIRRSLSAAKPVGCLLWGSVASAKTLFLGELSRLPNSHFVLGSNLSRAGLFEVLYVEQPKYLIIDELDKVDDQSNLACLLSLMQDGFITETKYRRHRHRKLVTWVFASANIIQKIPMELKSRFLPLKFKDYTVDEFYEVVVTILTQLENVSQNLAVYIAEKVVRNLGSRDVRDAVKIARLLKEQTKKDVDLLIDILKNQ